MSRNQRDIETSPARVWEVLADGWLYPLWVVGASRMRDVEEGWPRQGTRIHHSVGTWPVLLDDHTEVLEAVPEQLLRLRARAWPTGEAMVTIRLSGSARSTRVVIEEDVSRGPGRLVPPPLRALGLGWRNVETLRRLAYLAQGRARHADRGPV